MPQTLRYVNSYPVAGWSNNFPQIVISLEECTFLEEYVHKWPLSLLLFVLFFFFVFFFNLSNYSSVDLTG